MRGWIAFLAVSAVVAGPAFAEQSGSKKRRPLPPEYGRVVINNGSEKAGMAAVSFDHWYHRARYTCRLCHVDVGFAMKPGATGIKAADNQAGFYCGACHNGKLVVDGRAVFESCGKALIGENRQACLRCHSVGKNVTPSIDFKAFTKGLPVGRLGNGVDWEKAEEAGLVKPSDFLEGVSIPRQPMTAQKDFALTAKLQGMPEIIFSHKKHTVWNGCELCHPEIFVGVKKGATKYSMVEIFDGKYCGACHMTVAFPLTDCGRCHTRPVQ
jgi:c(7)-type cytochrome triheme protein